MLFTKNRESFIGFVGVIVVVEYFWFVKYIIKKRLYLPSFYNLVGANCSGINTISSKYASKTNR